jgi:hypothetical protein
MARIGALGVLAAGCAGCGGHDGASAAGAWTGTAIDVTGTRTVTGSCNQQDGEPTVVRCVFTVTDPALGTAQGTLFGHMFTTPGSSNGTLSYAFGIVPPPCRINVSGDAAVTPSTLEGPYRGANDCVEEPIRDGRLSLRRP